MTETASEVAIALATRDGHVTPTKLHERTGCALRYAYCLLAEMAINKVLRRVRQGIYSLPEGKQ